MVIGSIFLDGMIMNGLIASDYATFWQNMDKWVA
jgi:hypothetical protein